MCESMKDQGLFKMELRCEEGGGRERPKIKDQRPKKEGDSLHESSVKLRVFRGKKNGTTVQGREDYYN